jgi:hypothetical protein
MPTQEKKPSRSEAGAAPGTTRGLLAGGMVAGPLYMAIGLAQAFTRDGFDISRHALSLLANGPLGWIQIGNLAVTSLLSAACAVGMRRVLGRGPGGTWGPRLVGVYGTGLLGAAVFRADPTDGFPPGTPAGQGEASWQGILHMVSFGIGFLCLVAACFVVARGFSALGRRRSATFSRTSAVVILACVLASNAAMGTPLGLVALYAAVVGGWTWLAVVAARLRSEPAMP